MPDGRINEVIGTINHFFSEQKILHELLVAPDRFAYRCGFSPHLSKCSSLRFELVVDESVMQSYVSLPDKVTVDEDAVAEFISRINPEFKMGRFQFNYRNGHIAFHFGQRVDVVKKGMDSQILMDQVYYPLTIMDRFAEGFYELAQGATSPEELAVKYLNSNRALSDKKQDNKL